MGKTKTIIVIEPIQLTQFFMPKIGVEKVVDDGEDKMEVFKEARKEIEAFAREAYPDHFKPEKTFVASLAEKAFEGARGPLPFKFSALSQSSYDGKRMDKYTLDEPGQFQQPEEKPLLQLIEESKTVSELKSYHLLLAIIKDPHEHQEMQKAYREKMDELQKLKGEKV